MLFTAIDFPLKKKNIYEININVILLNKINFPMDFQKKNCTFPMTLILF